MVLQIDFSHQHDDIHAALSLPREEMLRRLTAILFAGDNFVRYAQAYLAAPLVQKRIEADILSNSNELPCSGRKNGAHGWAANLSGRYTHFSRPGLERQGDVRMEETYPLPEADVMKARRYLAQHIELHYGVMVIKDMLADYLEECAAYFDQAGKTQTLLRKKIEGALRDMMVSAYGFTLPHDLSPQLARSFADANKPFNRLDHGDFRKALVDIFRNQAMKSTNGESVVVCPFSSQLARVFSMKPVETDKSHVMIEQGQFGDLLRFVCAKIENELAPEALAHIRDRLGLEPYIG